MIAKEFGSLEHLSFPPTSAQISALLKKNPSVPIPEILGILGFIADPCEQRAGDDFGCARRNAQRVRALRNGQKGQRVRRPPRGGLLRGLCQT